MIYNPTLSEWNWHVLMLNQAMIGAISDNFRMVTLKWDGRNWLVEVVLSEDSDEDQEEAHDIADQMSIFLMDVKDKLSEQVRADINTEIIVSKSLLSFPSGNQERVVFKKRE